MGEDSGREKQGEDDEVETAPLNCEQVPCVSSPETHDLLKSRLQPQLRLKASSWGVSQRPVVFHNNAGLAMTETTARCPNRILKKSEIL